MREVTKIKIRHKDSIAFIDTNNEERIKTFRELGMKEEIGTMHFKRFVCDPDMIGFKAREIV